MISPFIDRDEERFVLEEEWSSDGGRLIVLYGRRRLGKTRLLFEFSKGKKGIMYFSEETPVRQQIKGLQEECARFLNDSLLSDLKIESWSQLFSYLVKNPPSERSYLIIDEFTYLIKADKSVLSALQKAWDNGLSDSKWCIILSGSILGLMSELALSYTSPIYGRRTRDILLEELPFCHAKDFLRQNFEDSMKTYFTIGGVPEYLQKASEYDTFDEFAKKELFSKYGYFYREPYFLLSQEFRELKIYQGILRAIANGRTKPSEIASHCGIETRSLYPYLEGMIRLGFVEKESPLLGSSRNSIYNIKDHMLGFWYRYVYPEKGRIETGSFRYEDCILSQYFGAQFEKFIRYEIAPLIFPGYDTGRWWHKGEEIDFIAINKSSKKIVFGECKYGAKSARDAKRILEKLKTKSGLVHAEDGYEIKYALFAGKVNDKESLLKEGYLIYDLDELKRIFKDTNIWEPN
ncbi:ATP-binding protein [Methanomicrobium antiquum]|uniref:ATP-binding protein n=1 Tax=Methanomicrobium antiquum TaxID=487686 RepID=A0AAF0JLV2_9EURY|nr:ATP-binding protein [Methanomicrobium antiquum]WFN35801.1 ATP-binding protein [Methanomicrobium antiquum]